MRGFVSILFLIALSSLTLALHQSPTPLHAPHPAFDTLFLRRTEMENGVDTLIRDELFEGLVLKLPPETIRTRINTRLHAYLADFPARHGEPIQYEEGIGTLVYTQYSSLLLNPILPTNPFVLDAHSHVLVLPVTEKIEYGEYSYTGGTNGTGILVDVMQEGNYRTLFALPSGYRVCATNLLKEWPCPPYGGN